MGELLLLRHGETAWSKSGQHTSYTDLPLTERGEREAAAVAPLLAKRDIARVFVSPLHRARETARLAGLDGHDPVLVPDLHEWDYGGYEGVTTEEIHRTRPAWTLWDDGVVPGPAGHPGESPEEVGARADRVLAMVDLANTGPGDVVLVAHGHFLRVLTARRLGLEPAAGALFRLDTATLSRLGTEHGRPAMTGWNLSPEV
ncbi:histidine phosphatase family protein [Mangrovactinospora gilvigrisea]|uniref:Histidine phosphatase family protein n=1 Tax=Mangrovactinospora gilvigrisea TaxID=1428644 RepID=A0A1J7C7X1_9ACTN|nr:histidine phosphatase family protein [Mangrovactinospora gilvigrisea]OIV35738.1 histidine phosphatase family protein [Mangrovactinospora gilvigrisea]